MAKPYFWNELVGHDTIFSFFDSGTWSNLPLPFYALPHEVAGILPFNPDYLSVRLIFSITFLRSLLGGRAL
jgi:hypothetical protein